MLARRAGDRQHIVEAHADVRDRNRPGSCGKALGGPQAAVLVADDFFRTGRLARMAKLAPHLPCDPQEKQATSQD
jgi:hypothetical protein